LSLVDKEEREIAIDGFLKYLELIFIERDLYFNFYFDYVWHWIAG